jgi:hypothetical protein
MAQTNVQAFSGDVEISSNLAVDTNTLFVDSVGNKVGVGTTNPGTKLSVYDVSSNLTAVSIITDTASVTNEPSFSILDMKDESGYGGYIKGFHNPFVSNGLQFGSIVGNSRYTEVMTILASGNVGIGTTDPLNKLDVMTSAGGTGLYIRGSGYGTNNEATHIRIGTGGGAANAHHAMITGGHTTLGSSYLTFSTIADFNTHGFNPAERMRINNVGYVGIGTTIPYFTLDVQNVDNANPGVTARFVGGGGPGIRFVTGIGGTSNNWKSTGIGLSGTVGGGAIFFVFTMNNSGADNSGAVFYFIRKPYDQAYWEGSAYKVIGANGGGSSENVSFRNSGGILEYTAATGGNGYFYAIEFDS